MQLHQSNPSHTPLPSASFSELTGDSPVSTAFDSLVHADEVLMAVNDDDSDSDEGETPNDKSHIILSKPALSSAGSLAKTSLCSGSYVIFKQVFYGRMVDPHPPAHILK